MSLRRPTVALLVIYLFYKPFMWCRWDARLWHCLLLIYFISPLGGVIQTPDCGILFPTPSLLIHVAYKQPDCMHKRCFIYDWWCDHRNFSVHDYQLYYPSVHNVCEYIQSTHWLVIGYCLGQISAWRGALRWQPRKLSNGDSSLAKIGVDLVSCSCGKWSPIDTDDSQTASAIDH